MPFDCMYTLRREIEIGMGHFRNFWTSVTLTLTLDRVIRHNVVYTTYTANFVQIG